MGGVGFGLQASQTLGLEGMNSFPNTLVTAVEVGGHLLRGLALAASQENLATPEGESVGGAQPLLQGRQFLLSKLPYNQCSHASIMPYLSIHSNLQTWICTSAESGDPICNGERLKVRTAKIAIDPLLNFLSCQLTLRLHDGAFAMHPAWFNWVQPGTFHRQQAGQDADPTFLLGGNVVFFEPTLDPLADVPGGIVPHQQQSPFAQGLQFATDPRQEPSGHPTDWATIDKAQPYFLLRHPFRVQPTHQQPVAGQGFGVRVILGHRLLHQPQGVAHLAPGVRPGPGQPAKPGLVLEAQGPVRMGGRQADQPVPGPLFLVYARSGLVIHCLARCQRIPRRSRVARMVSPRTRWGVSPCWKLTSAANSSVQTLVGWPKVRGLWCSKARNCAVFWPGKAAWMVWGREEPSWRLSRPDWLKALIALRTVCWSQPRWWAICGARSPLALARRIWQRRRTKALGERKPASNCWRSASAKGRTKMGGFMPLIVIHTRTPCLNLH